MSDGTPHTREGYIRIANELHEAIAKFNFTGRERRVMDAIIAKTYGFNKPRDRIAQSQIAEYTKIYQANVSQILTKLIKKRVILSTGKFYERVLEINKLYDNWLIKIHIDVDIRDDSKRRSESGISKSSDISTSISKSISTSISKSISTSICTKDTRHKTKDLKHLCAIEKKKSKRFFEIFWNLYPRKLGKKAALARWLKINPNKTLARNMILKVLETNEKKWAHSESKFIPHASTWLNGERWNDQISDERNDSKSKTDYRTPSEQTRDRLDEIERADIQENWTAKGNRD